MILIDENKAKESDLMKAYSLTVNEKKQPLAEVWDKKLKKKAVFEVNPSLATWDDQNQRWLYPNRNILSYFSAYDENATTDQKYQYAEKQTKKKNKDGFSIVEMEPRRISWTGKAMVITKADLFLFMFLNKNCLNSPFREKGAAWLYKLKDTEAESEVTLDLGKKLQTALEWINTLPGSELRIKAKAMSISDNQQLKVSIGNLSNATDAEVKARLTTAAIAQPVLFYDMFNNETNDFFGAIEEAMELGIITKVYEGQRDKWIFGKGDHKNTEIAVVQPGMDAIITLRETIAGHPQLFYKIKNAISGITIQKNVEGMSFNLDKTERPAKAITADDVIEAAFEDDMIAYDRNNMTYNFIDEDGQLGDVIYDHNNGDPKKHRQGLSVFLDSPDGGELLAKLKELTGLDEPEDSGVGSQNPPQQEKKRGGRPPKK